MDRELFAKAGASGFLGMDVPEELGGGGVHDFRYNLVIGEEVQRAGAGGAGLGLTLHNDICMPYFLAPHQRRAEAALAAGHLLGRAHHRRGHDRAGHRLRPGLDDHHRHPRRRRLRRQRLEDLHHQRHQRRPRHHRGEDRPVAAHKGMSLLVLERGMDGFERGRNLEKVGLHAQDTAELFFTDVRVPVANRLGEEGTGLPPPGAQPARRSGCRSPPPASPRPGRRSTGPSSTARSAPAFGQPIGSFQNSRFKLAEMQTEIEIGQAFVDQCVLALNAGELTAEEAAMAKWWCTELQGRVIDAGVQLHGGYGYMTEYPIARAYADARITRIYGGTTEIMKEIIGRTLGI